MPELFNLQVYGNVAVCSFYVIYLRAYQSISKIIYVHPLGIDLSPYPSRLVVSNLI